MLFRGLIGHTRLKADRHLKAPHRTQQAESTHSVPATFWELPQLQAIARTGVHTRDTHALPAPSCLQIPSVSPTSDFTFFLGSILGRLPKHAPFIVSASYCHRKDTWDGWRWGPTTEQIHVPGTSQWTYNQHCLTGQYKLAKTGQEATQGASPALHNSAEWVLPSHVVYSSRPVKCCSLHGLF